MAALGGLGKNLTCREITDDDLAGVVSCLRRGFPTRSRLYWERGLARIAARPRVETYPKYGYALVCSDEIVGVLLMIISPIRVAEDAGLLCNLSSCCVDLGYRSYGPRLAFAAFRRRDLTFTNVSPTEETWNASGYGFTRYCEGQIIFIPALSSSRSGDRVLVYQQDLPEAAALDEQERLTLAEHGALDCLSLICVSGGTVYPVILQRKTLGGFAPSRQIIYCRDVADMPRISGALGRYLLRRGVALCVADANGPIEGLVGRYFPRRGQKYFRGPHAPNLGDLRYSEFVFFGP